MNNDDEEDDKFMQIETHFDVFTLDVAISWWDIAKYLITFSLHVRPFHLLNSV